MSLLTKVVRNEHDPLDPLPASRWRRDLLHLDRGRLGDGEAAHPGAEGDQGRASRRRAHRPRPASLAVARG